MLWTTWPPEAFGSSACPEPLEDVPLEDVLPDDVLPGDESLPMAGGSVTERAIPRTGRCGSPLPEDPEDPEDPDEDPADDPEAGSLTAGDDAGSLPEDVNESGSLPACE